jgi:hypothetical protein
MSTRLRRERDARLTFLSSKELQADLTRPRQRDPLPPPIALYAIVVIGIIASLYFFFRA